MIDVIASGRRHGKDIGALRLGVAAGNNQEREQYDVLRSLYTRYFAEEAWPWELVEPDATGEPGKVFMARAVAVAAGFDELAYAREHDGGAEVVRVVEPEQTADPTLRGQTERDQTERDQPE